MAHQIATLATGYGLIEGPRVDDEGNLYFSDVINGGVRRLDPDGDIHLVVPKRRGVGGIALHADGGLVISGRDISHVVVDGSAIETRVVFQPGAPGLNDLFTDEKGRVYCGTIRSDPFGTDDDRAPGECHRIELDGSTRQLYDGVSLTNGIGLSPDGRRLYHADTMAHHVICHDLVDDEPVNRRALGQDPAFFPDGLAVDEAGTIWVADYGAGRVRGLSPDGAEVGSIPVPAKAVTSLCFGGPDRRDLYIVSADNTDDPVRAGSIFRTRVDVPGLPVAPARV
jgi:xylono-1,5-lactonase